MKKKILLIIISILYVYFFILPFEKDIKIQAIVALINALGWKSFFVSL